MIFLDAYCLVALARDEPAAPEVERLLREQHTAITSVNLLEVVDILVRRDGWPEADVRSQLSLLDQVVTVMPVTYEHAWTGALLRATHYAKGASELSLADSILLASAGAGDSIATSDPAVAAAARAESIDVMALPDTHGRRP